MKRTDIERRERELARVEKRNRVVERKTDGDNCLSVGGYIDNLFSLFRYDEAEIFNTSDDLEILELLEGMKEHCPEKQWENILRKAIRKTKVANKEKAFNELLVLLN